MRIHGFGIRLTVDTNRWSRLRETPIWLSVYDREFAYSPAIKAELAVLEQAQPSRLLLDEDELLIPIYLPTGTERAHVVQAVFKQVEEIAGLLQSGGNTPS